MKKRIMALLLIGCMAMTACGSKEAVEDTVAETEEQTEPEENVDTDGTEKDNTPVTDDTVGEKGIDAFMTLGEYKGIELEKTIYTVTEEDIDNQIAANLAAMPVELTDPEATVAVGDTINLDYSGSVDGEVFDGGTAEGQSLTIGSGQFIDGFEDQMVGMKVGESGEIEVTFPEEYHSEELQGKDAVFAVTVNSISRPQEEVTEEWLLANTEYTTIEEYRESIRTELETTNEQTTQNELSEAAWLAVFTTASFKQYPKDLVSACYDEQKLSYEYYASSYGMEYQEFLESAGIIEDDLMEAAKDSTQVSLTLDYICSKEDMGEDSQIYQDTLEELLAMNGFTSKDEALAAGITEWNIDFVVKYDCVMEFIVENAVITEVEG